MEPDGIVFARLMGFLPSYEFRRCVRRYRGEFRLRCFSCPDQFLAMAFAQLTYRRESGGHPDLSAGRADHTLSCRLPWRGRPQHAGQGQ
jgi:hypothetical protein